MTGEFTIAVHGLVFLNHKGGFVDSAALARNVCTNPARVRKVMAKLKRCGMVEAKEGMEGGYRMAVAAGQLDLAQVCAAVACRPVPPGWRSGDADMDCLIASGMADILDGVCEELNALCLSRLSHITIADIDAMIFGREGARK